MRLDADDARDRFAAARVARLATVRPDGAPHLVPIVYAVDGDSVCFVVDGKPKTTTALQRLANIAAEPRVSLLVDRYDDDWSQLWWVRADGVARVLDDPDAVRRHVDRLTARYPVYRREPPPGPVVLIEVTSWSGWSASG